MMDITAVISLVRHGKKDDTGNLTEGGHLQSKKSGIQTTHLKGDIILFHSGVGRVKDTIRTMGKYLHLNEDVEEIIDDFQLQDYETPFLHYLYNAEKKGEYFAKWNDIVSTEENELNRMINFLNFDSTSPEPDIFPSPKDMFRRVCRIIRTQIDFALLTKSSYRTNFINGSHEPVIMAFIYFLLKQNSDTSEIIKEWGGSIKYAEACNIIVYQDDDSNDFELELVFRDKKISLNKDVFAV